MAQALERIVQHREFQGLPYEQQVALMSNILGNVSPDLAGNQEALTLASEKAIRQYRPRSGLEKAGSFILGFVPVGGPLIQQYGFGENVPPPGLLTSLGVTDEGNPYGGLIRAGLDVPLMIVGGAIGKVAVGYGARYLPSLLNRSLPALLGRELIAGAASGTGELVIDPPQSVPEAAARLGLSAIAQAGFTAGGKMLFGAEARTTRALKRELGEDGIEAFRSKVNQNRFDLISDTEIGAFERSLGNRKDVEATNIRSELSEIKIRRTQMVNDEVASRNLDNLRIAEAARVETERLNDQMQKGLMQESLQETNLRAQEEIALRQQAEGFWIGREVERERLSAQPFEAEYQRQKEIDGLIKRTESGPVARGGEKFLQSERQLIDLLNDVKVHGGEGATFPFIGNDPTTLPIGMIQDIEGGLSRAVVVERLNGNRGELRYVGTVDRRTLRLPQTMDERLALRKLELEQNIKSYPDFERARSVLESRIEAERLSRLASLEARRFNSTEGTVQREIFRLRRDASLKYLEAQNAEVGDGVGEKIKKTKTIDNQRTMASVESLSASDAEATAKALRSAGFEQVRIALRPDGTFDVAFTNQDSPELARLARLHSRYITFKDTLDPTSTATYAGLTPAEHEQLGKAFGIDQGDRDRFNQIIESYTKELRDRGIRFPVTTEALGVAEIEEQVAKGAKRAQRMRSEVIASSEENVRRIDAGDVIEYQGAKSKALLLVADKTQTFDPDGNGLGTTTYHLAPISQLGKVDPQAGNIPTIPLTEKQLKQIGAKRSVAFPISPEQQPKFSIQSPSRYVGDLFGLSRDQMPIPTVEGNERALRQAAGELGLKVSVAKDGMVRLSGVKVDLENLRPEDTALILSRLKQFQQDRVSLLNFFEGCV